MFLDTVVIEAPLSTIKRTSWPLSFAVTQKWPSSEMGMRIASPATIGVPVASARSRCPMLLNSLRNEKRMNATPKIATQASTILSALPRGIRIPISELATSTISRM